VGLTHAARGNATGGARLLRRGAGTVEEWASVTGRPRPYDLDLAEITRWAGALAAVVERDGGRVDAAGASPRLRGRTA
jgi:hypothetical protein